MQPSFLPQWTIVSGVALLLLVGCALQSRPVESGRSPASTTQAEPSESVRSAPADTPIAQVQPSNSPTAANPSTGHLLSPTQVAELTSLPIPVVVPTNLPAGFRVVNAHGEAGQYANGDDDSGYVIEYQGNDDTCFDIRSSSDGPDRLRPVGQVQSALGTVNLYEETYEGRSSLQSFIPVQGNPVMISPVSRLNPTTGNYEDCQALNRTEYERILQSIDVLK